MRRWDETTGRWRKQLSSQGGTKPGQVIGATDKHATAPTGNPVGVNDLLRTISVLMGIDPDRTYYGPLGRPVPIVDGGEVIRGLI